MVDYDYTSHEYRNGKKRFVPKSDYVKFHDGYWYPVRMTTYLYWFKFLQEAELSREFEVDWKKYKDWGSKEEIMDELKQSIENGFVAIAVPKFEKIRKKLIRTFEKLFIVIDKYLVGSHSSVG
ncbi:MAG: hypothetical protein HOB71_04820 [Alphaproteobacteria bacterium]|nr:hypothetical protein [Alphaproteobacteria bacterium]